MKFLLLWFEAPLQCWGFDSKFDRRDTLNFPTKSGVFGILLAAAGASGPQREILDVLSHSKMSVSAFRRTNSMEPLLEDFHMIGNGYMGKDPWKEMHIPRKNDGAKAVGGGAKLTYRYFLQDKAFAVVLHLPDDLAERFEDALKKPKFDLYLGRKCCVPTDFVFQGLFNSKEDADTHIQKLVNDTKLILEFFVEETSFDDPQGIRLCDVPVQFGSHKVYRDRAVVVNHVIESSSSPNVNTVEAVPEEPPPDDSKEFDALDLFTRKE